MKDLLDILTNEDKSFEFPWWVYAIVMPLALVVVCVLIGN
jgi:hypothetical protein